MTRRVVVWGRKPTERWTLQGDPEATEFMLECPGKTRRRKAGSQKGGERERGGGGRREREKGRERGREEGRTGGM